MLLGKFSAYRNPPAESGPPPFHKGGRGQPAVAVSRLKFPRNGKCVTRDPVLQK